MAFILLYASTDLHKIAVFPSNNKIIQIVIRLTNDNNDNDNDGE